MEVKSSAEADISVIVPVYNVEEYLEECLDSLLAQTKDRLEVILIDDGSQDSSGEIAKAYAAQYENFHYHYEENSGLGHARNYGVTFATGKYIIFLDSDDVVAPDAYEKMFILAERNNSDLTICNVVRFNSKKTWSSALHKRTFDNIEENTHIFKNPNLIYDTTSWNKLIKKSFWLEHHFQFPEHILYEDIPVTIPMHCLANNVSVVRSVGYLWRARDGASKSITQSVSNMANLTDRITVMKMVDRFFEAHIEDERLHRIKQAKALEIDLMIFVNICRSVPAKQAEEILDHIKKYMDEEIDEAAFDSISLLNRQKYALIQQNDLEGLLRLIEYQSQYYSAPLTERDGRFFAELPAELFPSGDRDVTNELALYGPRNYINDIQVKKGKMEIFAHVYIPRVNLSDSSQQKIEAFLYNEKTGAAAKLLTEPVDNQALTASKGDVFNAQTGTVSHYNYDGTGFKIVLDLNTFSVNERTSGWNTILVRYENRLTSGCLYLKGISQKLRKKFIRNTDLIGSMRARIEFAYLDEIRILLQEEDNFAADIACQDGMVVCTMEKAAKAVWACSENESRILFDSSDGQTFAAPVSRFAVQTDYELYLQKSDGSTDCLFRRNKKVTPMDAGDRVAIFRSNRTYSVRVCFHTRTTLLQQISKDENQVSLRTTIAGCSDAILEAAQAALCVDDGIAESKVVLAVAPCRAQDGKIHCAFTIDFTDERLTKDLYQSSRNVYMEYELPDGSIVRDLIYSANHFNYKFYFETLQLDLYRFADGYIRLKAEQLWREAENTLQKRKALIYEQYPQYRQKKIHPRRIVFESMWGSKYSCNPQHLYEYIDKNYPEYECIWSLKDARTPVPGHAKRVRRGSLEYFYYLATAKYFVNNVNFETDYVKRDGQIEIQTMHGTPLKTLGLDVEADFPNATSRQQYIEKNHRWDYLIVQGKFMEDKAESCFAFQKDILRTGYPRTDILFDATSASVQAIKKKLGLPLDKKIILYAPTWRVRNKFDMQLDLEKMRAQLSEEYILLIRLHHFCAGGYTIPADDQFIFNLNAYNCVEELYLISDILITDYSSIMFDYALLKKPMLFFTYDLEEYSERLRGVYVDIQEEAPGPLVFSTEEVLHAILNLDAEMEKCRGKIQRFYEKFLTYENGESCRQIVETVFRPKPLLRRLIQYKRTHKKA